MNLAKISIKNPIFILSIVLMIIIVGWSSLKSMSLDLFPDMTVPVVSVVTIYPGAGPSEIETLVTRQIEEQVASISGVKRLSSKSLESMSQVVVEFRFGMNIDRAQQDVRDKVSQIRNKLPTDIKEPIIRRFDLSDQPIIKLALKGDLEPAALFNVADQIVKPSLERVNNVALVEILGGRKREIQVLLDRKILTQREVSVSQVAGQIGASGENIPSGKVNIGAKELSFRGLGEFESISQIANIVVNLFGNEIPTRVGSLGRVVDTLEDEKTRAYVGDTPSLFLDIYRQSGTNTVEVAEGLKEAVKAVNIKLAQEKKPVIVEMLVDSSEKIKTNVDDVYETIFIAILLTIFTVYLFLGNFKTTLITALALPVSLLGAFIAMKVAGFSLNIVSLISLSLAVGLLVDDAIVIIENIHRHIESGKSALLAAEEATNEIQLSVFAITMVVVAIFVPVGFMSGIIGQFFKQFGLTIAFAMMISFFVALTLIPMLGAYFSETSHKKKKKTWWDLSMGRVLNFFEELQIWAERVYGETLKWVLKWSIFTQLATLAIFIFSLALARHIPSAFTPEMDFGEVSVNLELEPGTSLDGTQEVAEAIKTVIKKHSNIELLTLTIGGKNGEANKAQFFIRLKDGAARQMTTSHFKQLLRDELKDFAPAKPVVTDYDMSGGMKTQPLMLGLQSLNQEELDAYVLKFIEHFRQDSRIKDLDSSYRPGKPEIRLKLLEKAANTYGITSKTMGTELRAQVEGFTPAKYREQGQEFDVRVRLLPEQRDLKKNFSQILIPNLNYRLVRLSDIAKAEEKLGPSEVNRLNRNRSIQITGNLAPGVGLSDVTSDMDKYLNEGDTKMPASISSSWMGDVEYMAEMSVSSFAAIALGIIFVYFILASLYGSFLTPVTILIALPLAISGAFYALYIANEQMNIFTFLGIFLLLGVAGKNSILLVDFANQRLKQGKSRAEAIIEAGQARLRPILMTSFALIAGTLPVAIGLNEASKMRTAMGWAIIGGVLSSTFLTLIVVPAIFSGVDRFGVWSKKWLTRIFLS